jgi:hypothetical protein
MRGVLEMQETNATAKIPGVRDTCASCGGDPGGLVWQGLVLNGGLTAADIARLIPGAIDQRGAVHLFATGKLRGFKIGKCWVTTASQFLEDWELLQKHSRFGRGSAVRRQVVVEVAAR